LEKLKFNRLNFFVEKYNIQTNIQHGFRVGKLTAAACRSLIGSTLEVLDNHWNAVGIFLHLAEACNVLNHQILFKKIGNLQSTGSAEIMVKILFIKSSSVW
jgi:hypothetical protein